MQITTLTRLPQTYKNLQRVREILHVVAKYGFGDLVARLDLESTLQLGRSLLRSRQHQREIVDYTTDERIRMALEDLGPTFVKLGQILATRPDLIPVSLTRELRKLQDDVPAFSAQESRRQIESELGRPIDGVFEAFEDQPIAAASIAQVHRGQLHDGSDVAIKVRRPGLEVVIRTDLEIMRGLASLAEENMPELRAWSLVAITDEFARAISREIDLSHEAHNVQRFARNFEGDPHVHVLKVYPEFSTERVLVMEFIDGIKASDLEQMDAAGLDRKQLAQVVVDYCLRQIFDHGFFHADPHPGNLFVLPGNVIAPVDMGMMGTLEPDTRDDLLELLAGLLLRDADKLIKLFFRTGLIDDRVDVPRLRSDIRELIERYYAVPLGDVDAAVLLGQLFELLQRYSIVVPSELTLIAKALTTVEGMARDLDPELDPMRAIRPYVLRVYLDRLSDPSFLAREWLDVARSWVDAATTLPSEVRTIARDLRRGELSVGVRAEGLEAWTKEQARSSNRIAMSLLVGSTAVGSSLLLASGTGPVVLGLPITTWVGLGGFALAGFGSLFVVFGFLRSGRF